MNRTASIRIKGINISFLRENSVFIVLTVISLISILLGVLTLKTPAVSNMAKTYFNEYLLSRTANSFFKAFCASLLNTVKIPLLSFLCGTSVLGLIITPLLLSYVCFWYGAIAGYIYYIYGLSGIVLNLFVLILPAAMLIFTMLVSAQECFGFSRLVASMCIRNTRPTNLYQPFKSFCLKHLILLFPTVLSSLVDVALFNLFQKYFTF